MVIFMYKGIIFDLDGTLLNTLGDLTNAVNHVCVKFGFETHSVDEVRSFVGSGIRNLISRVVPNGFENEIFEDAMKEFEKFYAENVCVETYPYEDVLNTLKSLKEKNIKMCIVSNKRQSLINKLYEKFFVNLIEFAYGEDEANGIIKKPNPMMIDLSLSRLGLDKEEVLYVGDSNVDKKTADNSSLDCCLVTYGFRSKEELSSLNSKYLFDSIKELLNIL